MIVHDQNKGGNVKMSNTEVRVVNKSGKEVVRNGIEQGEIIVKGLGVMNESTERDGWLHTGDQGTIDKNGHIQIIEPHKDLTNNDGGKVSSIEIESVFYDHPAIQEIAVIATPDEKLGEILHAFVVLHENTQVTEQALIDFSKKYFATADCPASFTFMEELPKTRSGKILKVQLGQRN